MWSIIRNRPIGMAISTTPDSRPSAVRAFSCPRILNLSRITCQIQLRSELLQPASPFPPEPDKRQGEQQPRPHRRDEDIDHQRAEQPTDKREGKGHSEQHARLHLHVGLLEHLRYAKELRRKSFQNVR